MWEAYTKSEWWPECIAQCSHFVYEWSVFESHCFCSFQHILTCLFFFSSLHHCHIFFSLSVSLSFSPAPIFLFIFVPGAGPNPPVHKCHVSGFLQHPISCFCFSTGKINMSDHSESYFPPFVSINGYPILAKANKPLIFQTLQDLFELYFCLNLSGFSPACESCGHQRWLSLKLCCICFL